MELVFSFSFSVGFRDKTQLFRLAEKCLPTEQLKCARRSHMRAYDVEIKIKKIPKGGY